MPLLKTKTMAQYWIQTPVENAREVVQRYIDNNVATLTGYEGYTVTYDPDCEVVLYGGELVSLSYDENIIYYGTMVLPLNSSDAGSFGTLTITDINNNSLNIFDCEYAGMNSGVFPGIIWNYNPYQFNNQTYQYFIGYKFNLIAPTP